MEEEEQKEFFLKRFYRKNYKTLLIIPILLLVLSIAQIANQTIQTGDFINKGVSLKGGITINIDKTTNVIAFEEFLKGEFPTGDISVRVLSQYGTQVGIIVEASDVDSNDFVDSVKDKLNLKTGDYNVEVMGSALGESFFQETFRIVIIAFIFMGLVVFLYFGESLKTKILTGFLTFITIPIIYLGNSTAFYILSIGLMIILGIIYLKYSVPSFAVILSAFADIIITVAIVNLMGMKLGTAGIAAFLMLIGYSVDTDILLCTKVLKRKGQDVYTGVLTAMKTGLTMSITTMIALLIALSFAQSEVLKQIMIILLIGLAPILNSVSVLGTPP